MITSKANSLIRQDYQKALRNALIFLAPALLVLMASFADLVPQGASYGAFVLYLLNFATDLFKKWYQVNKYK